MGFSLNMFRAILVSLACLAVFQNRVLVQASSLWTQISKVKVNPKFSGGPPLDFAFPNPEYHGLETRATTEPEFIPQKDCNFYIGNLTRGQSEVITSPRYPSKYPPGLQCQWIIEGPPGTVLRATFFDIVTQPWFFYFFDYLAVSLDGQWKEFYRFTGDMNRLAPISLESKDNKLGLRFVSSIDLFNYRGFKMAYVARNKETAVNDSEVAENGENSNSTSIVQNGDGNDLSAICDYVPVNLPPDSTGDIPVKNADLRIIGGSEAIPHAYPFMVALVMDSHFFCGGSLIDERHVLTAAHCTHGADSFELFFGVHNMEEEEHTRQYQKVNDLDQIFEHPNYDPQTGANDISIIRLNHNVRINAFVQPVYLPGAYSLGNSFTGWKLTTMGWGDSNKTYEGEQGSINPFLKYTTAKVISNEECRQHYRHLITGNTLCTEGTLTNTTCAGDSGGPLVAKFTRSPNTGETEPTAMSEETGTVSQCIFTKSHRDRSHQEKTRPGYEVTEWYVQIGILSYGSRTCGSGKPVTYTRVTAYMDYISQIIGDSSTHDTIIN